MSMTEEQKQAIFASSRQLVFFKGVPIAPGILMIPGWKGGPQMDNRHPKLKPRSLGISALAAVGIEPDAVVTTAQMEEAYRQAMAGGAELEPHMMVVRCDKCNRGYLITNGQGRDVCRHLIEKEAGGHGGH